MCRCAPDCQPGLVRFIACRMADNNEKQARLAEALRANLRRRKAQTREHKENATGKGDQPFSNKHQSPNE